MAGFRSLKGRVCTLRNAMEVEVLKQLVRYQVRWGKNRKRDHVDGTVRHHAQIDVQTGFVVRTMKTDVGSGRQRRTLYSTLYGRYLRREEGGILRMTWKALKDVQDAEFDNYDTRHAERTSVC